MGSRQIETRQGNALTCGKTGHCQAGLTRLLASDFDRIRLHTLFELFRDLNIELVSVNPAKELVPG
jgi:hypothetical protein